MKEHYRGGRLLQKQRCGTVYASLCNMRIVLARPFDVKSVRPSLLSVNNDLRLGTTFHPLSNAAH